MEEVNSHLGVKNHDPDARPPRYGQQRAEEVLGCKMSGWMTPKLVGTEKLWGFPLGTGALPVLGTGAIRGPTHSGCHAQGNTPTPAAGTEWLGAEAHDIGWDWVPGRAHACTREGSAGQCTAHKTMLDGKAWHTPSRAWTCAQRGVRVIPLYSQAQRTGSRG